MNTNLNEVREKMIDGILTRLGGNMIDVELDNSTLQKCIDLAVAKLIQRGDAFVEESLVLLTLQKNQKEYILPNEIVEIQQIYRRGYGRSYGSTGGQNMDPFAMAWTNVYMAGAINGVRTGGLVTYELHNNYLKTAGKMFGQYMNYSFNPNTHKLIIAENPRADDEIILLHSYVDRAEYEVLQDRYASLWIENWAFAEALEVLGRIRSRFGSLPGPNGGVNQDGDALKTEAKTLKEELTKELNNFVPGGDVTLMPFSG
jgi:hypothetical protein